MKLVLMSANNTKEITEKIVELVGKPANEISVCMINEASNLSNGDRRWFFKGWAKVANAFGGKISCCNLLAMDIKQVETWLMEYDVIWCWGGNTDYLKSVFDKTGFSTILPKLLKTKVWVGSSAGSCIMCNRPSIKPAEYGVSKWFGYVNCCIRPHINASYKSKEDNKKNLDDSYAESQNQILYALSDTSAVIVDGQKTSMLGKKALKLDKGKVVEKV
ncbi:MAG: Type 1 glutamine amidotransferase-like domain-containing protein [Christensenellaceae bacterium]|nr:Type 1 glutamine amidotransferase-like domain-containing protein [Christensenellaceae bacterium]